ncbi:CaiB/BaiF CoA transferase family protein [Aminobacter aganoensis]|uniref:Formyl-CoA transferase/succinyl-CoA--D-citramalate CoA-transferase n=1 Tax=Aminobacter aganoensis TaxID=83264 RepID=A0A7X0FBC0_9HYPH|nr:CoA transferase [Aminobacter aganoensis]MBB6356546.1 formyl-CoA transferase/succinyl-CoA--D-citramalate CoA-transferase [Aminobacter aganoensis]
MSAHVEDERSAGCDLATAQPSGPLSHITVVELGSFIAGPFCGQLLADMGAEVIKVEPPVVGDAMRQWGAVKATNGRSLWWPVIGRNKRSITLDLRKPEAQQIVRELVRDADVLIENFRPGTLERWGLSPETLRQENDKLIVARVSGFGQTGPYSDRAGFGAIAEAMSGLRSLTGHPDRMPTRVGISIGDSLAGLYATIGVLSALVARPGRQGLGQDVDVSIAESVLGVLESVVPEFAETGSIRQRTGPILPGIAPSNLYPTADGQPVLIGANADGLFKELALAMDAAELAIDERFASHAARGRYQHELDEIIAGWTATKTQAELLQLMDEHGIPAGPVNDAQAVAEDPHFRAREAVLEVPDPTFGSVTMQGVFPKLSATPGRVRWTGPELGADTDDILSRRLGYDADQIARLRQDGVS